MTTNNHTAMALSAGIASQNLDMPGKIGVLAILATTHFFLDCIPHRHYFDYKNLSANWLGAGFELGFGLILLPIIIVALCHTSAVWLFACVIAASLFDFLMVMGIPIIIHLNHFAHWWAVRLTDSAKWIWEVGETIILFGFLFFMSFPTPS